MSELKQLYERNRAWSEAITQRDPEFFSRSAEGQSPDYLWIGCSDSRVPPSQLLGLSPGDVFVHRNIANQVIADDPNCCSAIQFAVEVLAVKHIIICGHYGCGGIKAIASEANTDGALNAWLTRVKESLPDAATDVDTLCELNVLKQVQHALELPCVRHRIDSGADLQVHGWLYELSTGRVKALTEFRDND